MVLIRFVEAPIRQIGIPALPVRPAGKTSLPPKVTTITTDWLRIARGLRSFTLRSMPILGSSRLRIARGLRSFTLFSGGEGYIHELRIARGLRSFTLNAARMHAVAQLRIARGLRSFTLLLTQAQSA